MVEACSTCGAFRAFFAETRRKGTLGRFRRSWETILKWGFKKQDRGVDWIAVARDRDRRQAVVNTVCQLVSQLVSQLFAARISSDTSLQFVSQLFAARISSDTSLQLISQLVSQLDSQLFVARVSSDTSLQFVSYLLPGYLQILHCSQLDR